MVYQQKAFNLKILKQDVDKYIEADEDYQKIKQKVDYLETIVDFKIEQSDKYKIEDF